MVSGLYPPHWIGGYEQIAEWVARGLRERGHEIVVLTGRGDRPDAAAVLPSLDVDAEALVAAHHGQGVRFPDGLFEGVRRHVFSRANRRVAASVIERERPDIVSFWNPAWVTFSPLIAARQAGVPSVVHISDVSANVFRNPHAPGFPGWARSAARGAVDLVLRGSRPHRVVVPSRYLAQRMVTREGLRKSLVEVVPWPIEPSIDRQPAPRPRAKLPRRLLFVGGLIPEKGPETLIRALAVALVRVPDLRLTLVGDGPADFRKELDSLARDLPIEFPGRLERPDVVEAYREHDALVFPSVWDEPFSVVPLEAMAMGLPVVATDSGGTPEAIEDGVDGLLVRRNDVEALAAALVRLATESGLAACLAASGYRSSRRRFGFEAFIERLESVYGGAAPAVRSAA